VTRRASPRIFGPSVTSSTVLAKPASTSCRSTTLARFRLKSNSRNPRALLAPGTSAVWPTSRTRRNAARLQGVSAALPPRGFSSAAAGWRTPCQASATTTNAIVPIRFMAASLARLAALDEGGTDEGDDQIAALVGSGVAAEHEPTFGPALGRARFHHFGRER